MKIMHLVGFYPEIGGPYKSVKFISQQLKAKGIQSGVCSILPERYDKSKLENCDYLDDLVYLEENNISLFHFWPSFSSQWKSALKKIEEYDLIHIHGIFDYFAFFIYKYSKKPYVISPHGSLLPFVLTRKSYLLKRLYLFLIGKKILKKAKRIIINTRQEELYIVKLGIGIKNIYLGSKIMSFSDLLDGPPKNFLREKFPYLKDKKLILFLGRISWEKGLDNLIPAFAELVKIRKDIHLLIVGPNNKGYLSKVNEWIKKSGISDYVSFMGPVFGKDKIMFFQDSDIFVLPSYSESFGISIVEAMYMGLPVIITENVGVRKYVEEAKAGLVVRKDKFAIANAMLQLIANEEMRKKMGSAGRSYIEKHHIGIDTINDFIEIYEEVLINERKYA